MCRDVDIRRVGVPFEAPYTTLNNRIADIRLLSA